MAKSQPDINDPNRFVLYRYHPSLAAAIIFVIAFAITTLLHIFQIVRKRTWYFIPLAVGGVCKCGVSVRSGMDANACHS